MDLKTFSYLINSDLYRITGKKSFLLLVRHILLGQSYQYIFWMRFLDLISNKPILKFFFYLPTRIILRHYSYKLGISIPSQTKIGSGFYIGHFGQIVVTGNAVIGKNCNLSQGVTIGKANRGKNMGFPSLGNNVYIGPGAKIIGAVKIGNNVAIGANCVVTKDIPDNSVVVGIPGKVISSKGSIGYINRTDYDS